MRICSGDPTLLEGSILKNMLLGVTNKKGGPSKKIPGADEAWELARWCGLEEQFLDSPESFSVGKGGRNLPLSARQIICLVRVMMSDADVLMLHKPTALLSREETENVHAALKAYVVRGGLWGLIDAKTAEKQGTLPSHYLAGRGKRTVLLSQAHRDRDVVPDVVDRVVMCDAVYEEGHVE